MQNLKNLVFVTSDLDFAKKIGQGFTLRKLYSVPKILHNSFLVKDALKEGNVDGIILDFLIHKKNNSKLIEELLSSNPEIPIVLLNNTLELDKVICPQKKSNLIHIISREVRNNTSDESVQLIVSKICEAFESRSNPLVNKLSSSLAGISTHTKNRLNRKNTEILAIGSSTGGPVALEVVLSKIPANFPIPIVITQHMPPIFTKNLSERLDGKCSIQVKEGEDGELLKPGVCYIAPGNYHMTFNNIANGIAICLNQEELVNSCRPSVDVMFDSLSEIYQGKMLAVILTGMGSDGAIGCKKIKNNGGCIIIQNQETSVVWGMPKAVFDLKIYDEVLPIDEIGENILTKIIGFKNI